jgi:hypothetical protein
MIPKQLSKVFMLAGVIVLAVLLKDYLYPKTVQETPSEAVSMEFPLKDGNYVVIQSGPAQGLTGPIHQTSQEKYALDIIKGLRLRDLFKKTTPTLGTPVYSPCKGNVRKMRDGLPDMPTGQRDPQNGTGNHVVVGCDQFDVLLAHLKKDSITVKEEQIVKIGELLGEIGNSGNSDGPHLHLAATRTDKEGNVTALPMVFNGWYLQKGDHFSN